MTLPPQRSGADRRQAGSVRSRAQALLGDLTLGLRYAWGLPRFLRSPTSLEEARSALPHRFGQRSAVFLEFMRRAVYLQPFSPYRALLAESHSAL